MDYALFLLSVLLYPEYGSSLSSRPCPSPRFTIFPKYDTALIAFDETTVCHIVAACVARRRIGFSSGINRGDRFLTDTLVFHPKQSVYETLYDLARCVDGVASTMPRPKLPGRYLAAFKYGEIHTHASTLLQTWEERPH